MSKAIDLFYRTTTGKTESVAERIRDEFGGDIVTLPELGSVENDDFAEYECLTYCLPDWEYWRSAKRPGRLFSRT